MMPAYPHLPFPDQDVALRVLVVDDQKFDREMLGTRLREVIPKASLVIQADSGAQAMEILSDHSRPMDCVLLDMHLADSNGLELTRKMLALRPEVTVIIVTADADMDKALQCLQAGAEDFLIKGEYSNMWLYRSIRYAMERHQSRVENLRLNEALARERELSAMQKEFIHLVSHEFRTPISIISGASQLLAMKAPALHRGEGAKQFQKIDESVARLIGLLDNVLRLSQMEDGKMQFVPELFEIQETIQGICAGFYTPRLKRTGDTMALHYYGDRKLIEYTLYNVIGNALKYSGEAADVEISTVTALSGVQIFIIDHGVGMSSEVLARAGEKFYRGGETSHIEGSGLGIYLARRFIEYHGGTLMFCSALGEGTTVRLFLPHAAALLKAA